jgi:hypothetical protein
MFLAVKVDGRVWDGYGWSTRGRKFCTVGRATRSLCENGEDFEGVEILPVEGVLKEKFK